MARKESADTFNNALLRGSEIFFKGLTAAQARFPNPPGKVPAKDIARMTLADLKRLMEG